jgi:hypothetical protein
MFYAKNLPPFERWARALSGAGLMGLGIGLGKGWLVASLVAGSGAGIALTGFFGFCPLCALAGRKLR